VLEFIHQIPASMQIIIRSAFSVFDISDVLAFLLAIPQLVLHILGSSLATGGLCAILLNLFIPEIERFKSAG